MSQALTFQVLSLQVLSLQALPLQALPRKALTRKALPNPPLSIAPCSAHPGHRCRRRKKRSSRRENRKRGRQCGLPAARLLYAGAARLCRSPYTAAALRAVCCFHTSSMCCPTCRLSLLAVPPRGMCGAICVTIHLDHTQDTVCLYAHTPASSL